MNGDASSDGAGRRIPLRVPYAEKDAAKAAGARWDRRTRTWYIRPSDDQGDDLDAVARWRVTGSPDIPPNTSADIDPRLAFRAVLREAGLLLDDLPGGLPVMDGQWHRVAVEGDRRGTRSGGYRGFLDGVPNGQAVNFKTGGETQSWVMTGARINGRTRAAHAASSFARTHAAAQPTEDRAAVQARAARAAYGLFANAARAAHDHPYLAEKRIPPGALRQKDQTLLVPLRDADGALRSLQFIGPDGAKRYLTGGRKAGCCCIVDPGRTLATAPAILVAEGYATAASLNEATGLPVAAAMDAGNLTPVARALAERHPEATLVIAADDDHKARRNTGLEKARDAARAVGGIAVAPVFTREERARGLTDFNDLARARGLAAVAERVAWALRKVVRTREDLTTREGSGHAQGTGDTQAGVLCRYEG